MSSVKNIVEEIRKNISQFQKEVEKEEVGNVIEVGCFFVANSAFKIGSSNQLYH